MNLLSEEAFATPEEAKAFRTACNLLGYSDRTESKLRERLREKGYSAKTVDSTVALCRKMGFLNEERMIVRQAAALHRMHLWGKRRILFELSHKGYAKETLTGFSFDCEELSEIDFEESAFLLAKKQHHRDPRKLYALLARAGYSPDEIRRALKRLKDSDGDEANGEDMEDIEENEDTETDTDYDF